MTSKMLVRTRVLVPALVCAALIAFAATPAAHADDIGVTANATVAYVTNGIYGALGGCNDPNWPSCYASSTNSGSTSASVQVQESGTTSSAANPPLANSSAFASVSGTEGHIGMSLSAYSDGIGYAGVIAAGNWTDLLTISSAYLPIGSDVTLVAHVGIAAEEVILGAGSASITACFAGDGFSQFCNSGIGTPVTVQFDAWVGEKMHLTGSANGQINVNNLNNPQGITSSSDATLVATNSAHFSINPLDPSQNLDLTLESGCSITNGYGCDAPVSPVPEPPSGLLLGSAFLLIAAGWGLRKQAWLSAR